MNFITHNLYKEIKTENFKNQFTSGFGAGNITRFKSTTSLMSNNKKSFKAAIVQSIKEQNK